MDKESKKDSGLIEFILSVPYGAEERKKDPDCMAAAIRETGPSLPLAPGDFYGAYKMKEFMDKMPGGFFIYRADREEEILYSNKAVLRMFNCDTVEEFRELTGNSFRGFVHPDDLEAVEASIWEQIANSRYDLDYVEYRIIQKGGEVRWVEDYGHFTHSETAGDVFYVFVSDATEKKRAQAAEKQTLINEKLQSEEKLRHQIEQYNKELKVIHREHLRRLEVIEGLSLNYESILYIDLDADEILPYRLSPRIEHWLGKRFEAHCFSDFVSDYLDTWVCLEDRENVEHAIGMEYIRGKLAGSSTYYVNYKVSKEGEVQYLQLRVADVGEEEHGSRAVLGCRRVDDEVRNVMEQKKMFEDAWNHAKRANIARNTFLSNMSHDMRTPLNAITGYTMLAKNHMDDPEKVKGYLDKIEASNELLIRLVNDVLEISRIESGILQAVESECSLPRIIEDIREAMLPRAEAKNLDFVVDLSGLEHGDVYVDGAKLMQTLFYLTDNAVEYTENGGRICVTVTESREAANDYAVYRFIVEDTGVGIAAEYLEHIFEPFERILNTTMSGVYGTGLGLTIVKQMVNLMGGSIEVQSTPGVGSRFTATFGLRIQQDIKSAGETACGELDLAAMMGQRKILLVDDNEINLEIEAELLQDMGFPVELASDGSVAVEKILSAEPGSYALVLMDIQMPVMDGYEASRAIRGMENPELANIPIIAVSANAFEEDRRMSRESGMNAHLAKPLDMGELLRLMGEMIRNV